MGVQIRVDEVLDFMHTLRTLTACTARDRILSCPARVLRITGTCVFCCSFWYHNIVPEICINLAISLFLQGENGLPLKLRIIYDDVTTMSFFGG